MFEDIYRCLFSCAPFLSVTALHCKGVFLENCGDVCFEMHRVLGGCWFKKKKKKLFLLFSFFFFFFFGGEVFVVVVL